MKINPEDLIIQAGFKKTGGGMWTGAETSRITIYHKPSGIEVSCETHRSQHRNKAECMKQLQEKLDGLG